MSHFSVLVIGGFVEEQLAPYSENLEVEPYPRPVSERAVERVAAELKKTAGIEEPTLEQLLPLVAAHYGDDDKYFVHEGEICYTTTYNPESHWDWYEIGGRWRGFFPLKDGVEYNPNNLGRAGVPEAMRIREGRGPDEDYEAERKVDVCLAGQVDFERARNTAGDRARKKFKTWEEFYVKHGRPLPWSHFHDKAKEEVQQLEAKGTADEVVREEEPDEVEKRFGRTEVRKITAAQVVWERARQAYGEQAAIAAANEKLPSMECLVELFGFDEETFVQRQRNGALVPYAVVKDGKWYAQGKMGFFGMSNDDKSDDEWAEEVQRLYDDLPPETLLTIVDCHI